MPVWAMSMLSLYLERLFSFLLCANLPADAFRAETAVPLGVGTGAAFLTIGLAEFLAYGESGSLRMAEAVHYPLYFCTFTCRPPVPEEIMTAAPAAIPTPMTIKVKTSHSYSGYLYQGFSWE